MSQASFSGRIPPGTAAQKLSQPRPAFASGTNYHAVGAASAGLLRQSTGAATAAPAASQPCPYPYYPYASAHDYAYADSSGAAATWLQEPSLLQKGKLDELWDCEVVLFV